MTRKSRYFLVGSAAILLLGIGGGLVAYYTLNRASAGRAGLPAELRFVPADAELVAYADVHAVMASDMRRELERLAMGPRRGQQQMHEFAGIDIEKDINHVVAYMEGGSTDNRPPHALVLAQGAFDQAVVERFISDHGGSVEDYRGKPILVPKFEPPQRPESPPQPRIQDPTGIAFIQPDLVAIGPLNLVRKALDQSGAAFDASGSGAGVSTPVDLGMPVTTNDALMKLMRDASSGNVWVVGSFDAMSRRMRLPANLRRQVPPLRFVSASARINGGVNATIRAETADSTAADQVRDVVRGAISLARLQAGSKPELQDTFKSIELGGSGTTVQLSFAITPDSVRAMTPQRPPRQQPTQ